jgi:zinc protease
MQAVLVNKEDLTYVKNEIDKVIEDLKNGKIDSTMLAETKSNLKYSYAMGIDSPDQIANSLAWYIWLTGNPEDVNKAYANYDAITPEDIQRVAQKYLVSDKLTVSTISPDESPGLEPELNRNL